MRSLLIVPVGESQALDHALDCGAGALVIDLTNPAAAKEKERSRQQALTFLSRATRMPHGPRIFVRINGSDSDLTEADLDAVMPGAPHGIVLSKSRHGADVQQLANKIAVREAKFGLSDGTTQIIAIATETPGSIFGLGSYEGASRRLRGLAWSAENFASTIGSESFRTRDGILTGPCQMARDMTLIAARAAGVDPIDTVYPDFMDLAGLKLMCEAARWDGFSAKFAIHPDQISIINDCFDPLSGTNIQNR